MNSKYFVILLFSLMLLQSAEAGQLKADLSEIISKSTSESIPVIILFHEKPTLAEIGIIKSDGASIKYQYSIIDAVAARIPVQAAEKIAKRDFVKLIEPDYKVKLILDKSILQIQADLVWKLNVTGKGIDIAILDTGIHDEHPALTVQKEVDYTGEGTDDLNGHGTHAAGIAASVDSTYRGVAYGSNLFNVKVLDKEGSGYGSDVIKGMEWAENNGAEIISMSLGAEIEPCDGTDAISLAVDKIVSKNVVAVVAAGNSGPDPGTITSPGCSKKGITVGAVDDNDKVPSWSGRGPTDDGRIKPDLVAPGVGIISTWNDNSFKSVSGTSMSTPHVSGVAALLLEVDSSLTPSDINEILKINAVDLNLDENTQGSGRVDAYATVNSILQRAKISITEFKTDKTEINISESFILTLEVKNSGVLDAEGVSSTLTLPDGLKTDNLTKKITEIGQEEGIISSGEEATAEWTVTANKEGKYIIKVDVISTNGGSDSAAITILVESPIEGNTILSISISAPETVIDKDSFSVSAIVKNEENITAEDVVVEAITYSGLTIKGRKTRSLGLIEPGKSKEVIFSVKAVKLGKSTITMTAAADNAESVKTSASILVEARPFENKVNPGSALYFMDRVMERLSLAFTFNEEEKAAKQLVIAQERLQEMNEVLMENKPEFVDELIKSYDYALEESKKIEGEVAETKLLQQEKTIRKEESNESEIKERIQERIREEEKIRQEAEKISEGKKSEPVKSLPVEEELTKQVIPQEVQKKTSEKSSQNESKKTEPVTETASSKSTSTASSSTGSASNGRGSALTGRGILDFMMNLGT